MCGSCERKHAVQDIIGRGRSAGPYGYPAARAAVLFKVARAMEKLSAHECAQLVTLLRAANRGGNLELVYHQGSLAVEFRINVLLEVISQLERLDLAEAREQVLEDVARLPHAG